MKPVRLFAALGLAVATLLALPVTASADLKIAVIRFDAVVRASPQYKAADDKMTGEFSKRKADLEAQGKQFDDDVKNFQRDKATMSPDQAAKTEKDLSARQVDLNTAGRKFQQDAAARQRDLTNEVVGKIREAIVAVAKDKNIDLVVPDPIYAKTSLDISNDVLKRLGGKPLSADDGGN